MQLSGSRSARLLAMMLQGWEWERRFGTSWPFSMPMMGSSKLGAQKYSNLHLPSSSNCSNTSGSEPTNQRLKRWCGFRSGLGLTQRRIFITTSAIQGSYLSRQLSQPPCRVRHLQERPCGKFTHQSFGDASRCLPVVCSQSRLDRGQRALCLYRNFLPYHELVLLFLSGVHWWVEHEVKSLSSFLGSPF